MAISATITIDSTTLLFQQAARCTAGLKNDTRATLRNINPGHDRKLPTLVLTNVANQDVMRFVKRPMFATPPAPDDLPGQREVQREFLLSDLATIPGPGAYEIQALYEWDGGRAISPPVRLDVLPACPRHACIAPLRGSLSAASLVAWVNVPDPAKSNCQLWLGEIGTSRRPQVRNLVRVPDLKRPVSPVLSVPPNITPAIQWIAWTQEAKLFNVLHRDGDVTDLHSTPLPAPGVQIIPPLLLHARRPGEQLPGAQVLLYEPGGNGTGARLFVMFVQLAAKGACDLLATIPMPDFSLAWARTAFLSNQSRYTFWLTYGPDGCNLKLSRWSASRMPDPPADLCAWRLWPLAADLIVTEDDLIRGVIFGESQRNSGQFCMVPWVYSPRHPITSGAPIPVSWDQTQGLAGPPPAVSDVVVRINTYGSPFALLKSNGPQRGYYFCGDDGSIASAGGIHMPADILFRYGYDPTILYTDPGRGFQFVKPG